jgi:exosortase A-associated hydrolase 1
MNAEQRALRFLLKGSHLVGVIDVPERPFQRGLLVVPSGAQYRAGGQRQFTLLARLLARRGVPVMRFDHRGMGDSEGDPRAFDSIEEDIRAAIDEFLRQMPSMQEVVVWGLGDAACAAALYAHADERVRGLVLLNPWVDAAPPSGVAEARQHYLGRLGELGFWKRVATGHVDYSARASSLRQAATDRQLPLAQRVMAALQCFDGQILVILSGADPTAHGFSALLEQYELHCRRVDIPGADHSFTLQSWRDEVAEASANWIVSW